MATTTEVIGEEIPIKVFVRRVANDSRDGELVAPYGLGVSIADPAGVALAGVGSFTYVQDGEYVLYWTTDGLIPGTYKVSVTVTMNNTGQKRKYSSLIRLVTGAAS